MAVVQKFLFDRSFDDPSASSRRTGGARASDAPGSGTDRDAGSGEDAVADPAADGEAGGDAGDGYAGLDRRRRARDEAAEAPPDLYSAAQLEAAREEGYIKGHTAALDEAAQSEAHVSATALRTIAEGIDRMDAAQQAYFMDLERNATRLAFAIARRLLPATAETVALEEMSAMVASVLPDLMDQPRLMVRVHGALADTVRTAVRDLQTTSGYEGRVLVRPDNTLAPGDCRLEWGDGGLERDQARLWSEIEAAVSRHLDEVVPPAPMPPISVAPSAAPATPIASAASTASADAHQDHPSPPHHPGPDGAGPSSHPA